MKFLELAAKRQSVRAYSDTKVDRTIIDRCIEAARLAPSACNSQPWSFVIIDNQELKSKIAKKTYDVIMKGNRFALSAPVLVAVIAEKGNITSQIGGFLKNKPFYLIDIGISVEHFCLQAVEEGLGTCILGWFDEKAVCKALDIPSGKRVALVIALGYPLTNDIRPKNRKSMEEVRWYNKYGVMM
jgi:nitroreductase